MVSIPTYHAGDGGLIFCREQNTSCITINANVIFKKALIQISIITFFFTSNSEMRRQD